MRGNTGRRLFVALLLLSTAGAAPGWTEVVGSEGPLYEAPPFWLEGHRRWTGWAVASVGDVDGDGYGDVVAGAPYLSDEFNNPQPGRVWILFGGVNGVDETTYWEGDQGDSRTGYSVASVGDIDGDGLGDIVFGEPLYDKSQNPQGTDVGRLRVLRGQRRPFRQWQFSYVDRIGPQQESHFGASVSSAGDINGDGYIDLIVSAPDYDAGGGGEGVVYLYTVSAQGLSASPVWSLVGDQPDAALGSVVASAGDVDADGYDDIIVSAPSYNAAGNRDGAVLVIHGSPGGLEAQPRVVLAGGIDLGDFGRTAAGVGDVNGDGYADVAVGAPGVLSPTAPRDGLVRVFYGSASGLSEDNYTELRYDYDHSFGWSVAGVGDVDGDGLSDLAVGTWHPVNTQVSPAVCIFLGAAGGVAGAPDEVAYLNGGIRAQVGGAGDVNGDGFSDLVLGDPLYDSATGQVFVYLASGSRGRPGGGELWKVEAAGEGDGFARAAAVTDDLDGDGVRDLVVGAYLDDVAGEDAGAVYVYRGEGVAFGDEAASAPRGAVAGGWFGFDVADAGDFDGDGFGDFVVGAPRSRDTVLDEGAVFWFRGSAEGVAGDAAWSWHSGREAGRLGFSVGRAGDVNGDGYTDVIAGGQNGPSGAGGGFIEVFYGRPWGLDASSRWHCSGEQAGEWFGYDAATAGDVNGDGLSDVIVGAPDYDGDVAGQGRAWVFYGAQTGLSKASSTVLEVGSAAVGFGALVACAGDINGDGFGDVVVGARERVWVTEDQASVFVFLGSATGVTTTPSWSGGGGVLGGAFGKAVAAGDIDRDGYGDLFVSDPGDDRGGKEAGLVQLFLGSAQGLSRQPVWRLFGETEGQRVGRMAVSAGDVDGDGRADVMIGSVKGARPTLGLHGTGNGVFPRIRPVQLDEGKALTRLGYTGADKTFDLDLDIRIPPGATTLRAEWEMAADGGAFGASGRPRSEEWFEGVDWQQGDQRLRKTVTIMLPFVAQRADWRVRTRCDEIRAPISAWVYASANVTGEAAVRAGVAPYVEPPPPPPPPEPREETFRFDIEAVYPNPFNPQVTLRFTLPGGEVANAGVYDVAGRRVASLPVESLGAGRHSVVWNGKNSAGIRVASGVYFVRLGYGDRVVARKVVLAQ